MFWTGLIGGEPPAPGWHANCVNKIIELLRVPELGGRADLAVARIHPAVLRLPGTHDDTGGFIHVWFGDNK